MKQQLWENLRAERIRNFKEEQERLKAQEEMDEDNYLDKMDKELENEPPPGLVEKLADPRRDHDPLGSLIRS